MQLTKANIISTNATTLRGNAFGTTTIITITP